MMDEKLTRFVDENCRRCKNQKPLMKKARCPMWHAIANGSKTAADNLSLFVDSEGSCRQLDLREE